MINYIFYLTFLIWLTYPVYRLSKEWNHEKKIKWLNFRQRLGLWIVFLIPWILNDILKIEDVYQRISIWTLILSVLTAIISSLFIIRRDLKLPEQFKEYCKEINDYCKENGIDIRISERSISKLIEIPASFALLVAFSYGGITIHTVQNGGLNVTWKIVITTVYLAAFVFFSWKYKRKIVNMNKEAIEKLSQIERHKNSEKRKVQMLREKNCLTKVANDMNAVLNRIDLPVFISFLFFTVIYLCLLAEPGSPDMKSLKYFGYGGVSLHVFTATILFLFDFSGEIFKTPIPKFK